MKHPSFDDACGICKGNASGSELFENDLWLVRSMPPHIGVPGWMMMTSQRHVPGPAHFNDEEAANFGLALRHFERVLEELREAGLDSMPGGGAEIFAQRVRDRICPDKADADRWLEIHAKYAPVWVSCSVSDV